MKRRDFLRRFGVGLGVAVAAPAIAKTLVEEKPWVNKDEFNAEMERLHGSRINVAGRNKVPPQYRIVTVKKSFAAAWPGATIGITTYDDVVRFNDKIAIPPEYTNKDIPTDWLVTGPYSVFSPMEGRKEHSFALIPYDPAVELIKKIPEGTTLFIPYNVNREIPS